MPFTLRDVVRVGLLSCVVGTGLVVTPGVALAQTAPAAPNLGPAIPTAEQRALILRSRPHPVRRYGSAHPRRATTAGAATRSVPSPSPTVTRVPPQPAAPAAAPIVQPRAARPPVGASFAEPVCVRSYSVPGLQASASADNTAALNAALAAAQPFDCLLLPAGTYGHAGNIDVPARAADVTLRGAGRDQTVLLGTSDDKHGFRVLGAPRFRLEDLTKDTVPQTDRTGMNQQGHSTLLLDPGTTGFLGEDLLLRGARAAGFFAYDAHDYHLNRVEVQDSLADAFHNTNGSSGGTFTDCVATNPGDDGWAMVAYGDGPETVPHDFVVTRFHMKGNPHGRGFGIINSRGLTVYGPTLIEDTSAAGIIIARETQYGPVMHPVSDIRFLGETRIVRANHNREDHGAVLIDNPEASQPVERVYLEQVVAVDTGKNRVSLPSHNVFVKGVGRISAVLKDFRFVGVGPREVFGGPRTADSSVQLDGWTAGDGYLAR